MLMCIPEIMPVAAHGDHSYDVLWPLSAQAARPIDGLIVELN